MVMMMMIMKASVPELDPPLLVGPAENFLGTRRVRPASEKVCSTLVFLPAEIHHCRRFLWTQSRQSQTRMDRWPNLPRQPVLVWEVLLAPARVLAKFPVRSYSSSVDVGQSLEHILAALQRPPLRH